MSGGLPSWSRRKVRLAQTGGVAILALLGAGLWVLKQLTRDEGYVPGEEVEGLTSELLRALPTDRPAIVFVDVTREAGIDFRHFGAQRTSQIVEDMGSGAAWGDFDSDGWPDLYVVNANPVLFGDSTTSSDEGRARLYHNLRDGTFRDVAAEFGMDLGGIGMGAAWADFDNDGRLDLVVSGYPRLHLFRNTGGGGFADVSEMSGLSGHTGFWAGVSWGDYDRDGLLDLYVTGYVHYEPGLRGRASSQYDTAVPASLNPSAFDPERNLLFHNDGTGRFTERALEAGVQDAPGRGLSAAWMDLNADGWQDLYVANDVSDNVLFLNQTDGTFSDVSHSALVADYRGAMGIAVGDWDGDRDLDLFLTHWIAQENALYSNLLNQLSDPGDASRRLQFRDDADRFGLGQIALDYVGWATSFLDFDNDGRLDLFVVNGSTFQREDDPTRLIGMNDQLFWNAGPQRGFFNIGPAVGDYFREAEVGRGGAAADYDRDGDLDLFVVNHSGPGILLRNDGEHGTGVQIELVGTTSNRDGIGAEVALYSADSMVGFAQHGSQASYLSQNEGVLHFGLGSLAGLDSVIVVWPDGIRENTGRVAAGGRVRVLQRGGAEWTPLPSPRLDREQIAAFWVAFRAAGSARIAGDFPGALAAYRRAHVLNPNHEDALYYRGHMARELGNFEEAGNAWRDLVEVNPLSARGFSELGWLALCAEPGAPTNPTAARDLFRAAMGINPEHTGAWIDASVAALAVGDASGAEDLIRRTLRADPDSPGAGFLDAYLVWGSGDSDRAVEILNRTPSAGRVEAPGTSEGDTEDGAAMVARQSRCNAIRRFAQTGARGEGVTVFAIFDSLLAGVRGPR